MIESKQKWLKEIQENPVLSITSLAVDILTVLTLVQAQLSLKFANLEMSKCNSFTKINCLILLKIRKCDPMPQLLKGLIKFCVEFFLIKKLSTTHKFVLLCEIY